MAWLMANTCHSLKLSSNELPRCPDVPKATRWVANGGIRTEAESRVEMNLNAMEPSLVLMGITYVLFLVVHGLLTRIHFYRLVWHRALFNVGLYALLLGAVDSLSRYLMT